MKFFTIALFFAIVLMASCVDRTEPIRYSDYKPVLITKESLAKSVGMQNGKPIIEAAKIYYQGGYLYISERLQGVHVIDNSNPSAPVNKLFISVPGCLDMAIKNNILYVDNAIDLVAINLDELKKGNLQIVKRIESVFPEPAPPDGGAIPERFTVANRPSNTIIVNWKK